MQPDVTDHRRDRIEISEVDPEDRDARACLHAYFAHLCRHIPGISAAHVPDPDPEAYAFRPPHGTFLVARSEGVALGCVSLKPLAPGIGEVKRLWVAPEGRGCGLGRRLMTSIEDKARTLGMNRLHLDTNSALHEAISLYCATGWIDIPPYTTFPADCWLGKDL